EYAEGVKRKGVAIKEVKAFKLATDAFAAVKAGQAEVIIVDEPVGKFYVNQDSKTFQLSGRAMAPEPVGVAIRKSDSDLHAEIKKAVEKMRQDGTMKKISETWFGGELGA